MTPDPLLGTHWWDDGWNPAVDSRSRLRRNQAFPAFSRSEADANPGKGHTCVRKSNRSSLQKTRGLDPHGVAGWLVGGQAGWP